MASFDITLVGPTGLPSSKMAGLPSTIRKSRVLRVAPFDSHEEAADIFTFREVEKAAA